MLDNAQTAALRQQAYLAARTILGTQGRAGTPENVAVSKLAESYTSSARQRLPGVISASQIMADPVFLSLAGVGGGGGGGSESSDKWGFDGQLVAGIKNMYLYGGIAVLGALVFWPKGRGRK